MPDAATARVAVIGGGWAGCAAAVTLAAAGVPVTMLEQARTLGGRARRVVHDGIALDNGQHVLLGAYRRTLALLAEVHGAAAARALFHRLPLTLRPFGAPPGAFDLAAWNAPAPMHVAGGLVSARGLGWRERLALVAGFRRVARRGFRCPPDETVAACLAPASRRAFAAVWAPLCLAALNTAPDRASAQMFAHVLRAAFTGSARHSDLLVPAVDLSACFPDAAARFVAMRGGVVRTGVAVRAVTPAGDGVALAVGPGGEERFAAAIVAVGPHQLAATVGSAAAGANAWRTPLAQVGAFSYESITTVYLGFAGRVAFRAPLLRLDDAPGHWVFDRSGAHRRDAAPPASSLVAVVISAGGPHDALDHASLAAKVEAQLRRLAPELPATTLARTFAERRATYACTPALARPLAGRIGPGLYLAGDYTDPLFPATLEAATRSGVAAAEALIGDRAGAAAARDSTRAP